MNEKNDHPAGGDPCLESKLLALHTSTVCLARALALSGALDREMFTYQLDEARNWLARFDECGHNVAAFDELTAMLKKV